MKHEINPDTWENHVPPVHPMALKRLRDFDRAIMALPDYPAYARGEGELTYYYVTDEGYNQALSLPVATKEEARKDLRRVMLDHSKARAVVSTLLI